MDQVRDVKDSRISPISSRADFAKFTEELHQYTREYIRNADQKASFFFAAATGALSILVGKGVAMRWWFIAPNSWSVTNVFAFLATVFLGISSFGFLSVIFPRLKSSNGNSVFFFGSIATWKNASEYADSVSRLSQEELVRLKLEHVYDLARICRLKFRALAIGFWAGAVGAVVAILYLASLGTNVI
jgi:hypothetical protein